MPEVSVIIPVYNTAPYLAECLESVCSQTLRDIEIICINDGSTDSSLQILKDFQKNDVRIKIIDQKNKGVSAARNAGMTIAMGTYVAFVDSDDTILSEFCEKLFTAAEISKSDVVFSNSFSNANVTDDKYFSRGEIATQIIPVFFKEDHFNSVCNKLYRMLTVRQSNIFFPSGKTHAEDAEFNIRFLMQAKRLTMLNYSGYNYRETPDSATRNPGRHPYLQNAVDIFLRDWSPIIGDIIPSERMYDLKKERLINNILSQVYIYGNAGNGMRLIARCKKLREIVSHPIIIKVFSEDNNLITSGFSTYKKQIYLGILRRSVITLYLLTQYSYYRGQ